MEATFNLQLGVIITMSSIIFSAGTFYMMGLFNNKKIDKMADQLSNVDEKINKLNDKLTNVQINQARSDEKLSSMEKYYHEKSSHNDR